MKPLDETCDDCPSRVMYPDITLMTKYLEDHFPETAKQFMKEGVSPVMGSLMILARQAQQIHQLKEQIKNVER